jgi:outer membrane lipoprotein-sorting protein
MKKVIITVIGILCLTTPVISQTADDIIATYLKNSGGIEKLKALNSLKLSGKIPSPQGEFAFTVYKKAPDKVLTEIMFQGMRLVPQAYDGKTAWGINPLAGVNEPQELTGEMAKDVKEEAIFEDPFINYSAKGHAVSYLGKEKVNGTDCYKLSLIKNKNNDKDDDESVYYFDVEYGLPILIKSTAEGQEIETYLSNYSEIDGYTMPLSLEIKMGGQTQQTINISKIEVNPQLSDDIFTFKKITVK